MFIAHQFVEEKNLNGGSWVLKFKSLKSKNYDSCSFFKSLKKCDLELKGMKKDKGGGGWGVLLLKIADIW